MKQPEGDALPISSIALKAGREGSSPLLCGGCSLKSGQTLNPKDLSNQDLPFLCFPSQLRPTALLGPAFKPKGVILSGTGIGPRALLPSHGSHRERQHGPTAPT